MSFLQLMKSYKGSIFFTIILGFATNILALYVPKLAAQAIDAGIYTAWSPILTTLVYIACGVLVVAGLQIYVSTYVSEKIALDLRRALIQKVSKQSFIYIDESTPGKLQTIFTSDVEAVKSVISQGFVTLFGAIVTLIGSIIFLLYIHPRLALYTISIIPLLILSFFLVFGKVSRLFQQAQENLQRINARINETITGSTLIRVVYGISQEIEKFITVNTSSRDIGYGIIKNFAALIPLITLLANTATLIIIWFGGKQVIAHTMTLGDFSAFLSYSAMFIWPLFVLSFVGSSISRGFVSLRRINEVLQAPVQLESGTDDGPIEGDITLENVSLVYKTPDGSEKIILKNISCTIKAHTKNAIVGPTAAGKSQLFYLMSGLVQPTQGRILIDGKPVSSYNMKSLLSQIGLVFQDSILFNTSLRENIAFTDTVVHNEQAMYKALHTAELETLVSDLPQGLETIVSERGTSLSGGQKQRLMLARALSIHPRILLLDDFTARVDQHTEKQILENIKKEYSDVTLVSITQKIDPIKDYDQIIVLMEGEIVGVGTHDQLLQNSFEYKQIYESQFSTNTLHQ